jgi:small subunit ribosomal protein S15
MIDKDVKKKVVEQYKQNEQDTGSIEIQIALLSEQIQALTQHCKENKNDFSSKRGLLKMVGKRRRFLNYLQKTNPEKHQTLVTSIGLRA